MKYEYMTTEKLIKTAAWVDNEADATEREKKAAKLLIKKELSRRFSAVCEFLEDGQNASNPTATYNYLLHG